LDKQTIELLTQLGAAGVLAFVVIALVKEWIMVGATVHRMLADKDTQIAAKDEEISGLHESVGKLRDELLEQVKMHQQMSAMTDKVREIAKQVIAETRRGGNHGG
jgi:uncharacterized coiled-coil protein SlyX